MAENNDLKKPLEIIESVAAAVEQWPVFAREAGVNKKTIETIRRDHRLALT